MFRSSPFRPFFLWIQCSGNISRGSGVYRAIGCFSWGVRTGSREPNGLVRAPKTEAFWIVGLGLWKSQATTSCRFVDIP